MASFWGFRKTACLIMSSLIVNVFLTGFSYGYSNGNRTTGHQLGLGVASTTANIKESWNFGAELGNSDFIREKLPGGKGISKILSFIGGSFLGMAAFVLDPNIAHINESASAVGEFTSNQSWWVASWFGFHKIPTGLVQVMPKSKKHPDGAIPFSSLTFDHYDEAKLHIQSTVRSITQGDPLKNAIFYGDAGTGKSAVARSFAHLKGFKVYSVSGHEMDLYKTKQNRNAKFTRSSPEKPSFQEITEWLKKASNKNNKIIVDISEGDHLLTQIATNPKYQNYFKQSYESSQQNYALFFSCNFNVQVGNALKQISETSELDRRFKDRVNFKTPSGKVRMLLLKDSINNTIFNLSSKSSKKQDKSIYFEASSFFDDIFLNRGLIKSDFIGNTEGYSHDHMIKLGQKLVQVYAISRYDQLTGLDPRLNEFNYIDNKVTAAADPLEQVLAVLRRPYGDSEWVMKKTEELIEKRHADVVKQIPLLKKEQEFQNLQRAIQSGNYNIDDNGNPINPAANAYGDPRGQYNNRFGQQQFDRYPPADDFYQ